MLKSDIHVDGLEAASGLALLVIRAGQRTLRTVEAALAPFGISVTQYFMLARLAELVDVGVATPGLLARIYGMDSGAMTRLLDRMEVMGLVERSPAPRDRRTIRLILTHQGWSILPVLGRAAEQVQLSMACDLSKDELACFRACLEAFITYTQPIREP